MIITDSVNVIDALLFGGTSQQTREAIAQEHQAFVQSVDPVWGATLIDRTRQLYNNYSGAHVVQMVQTALNNIHSISRPDVVVELSSIDQLQTALPVMQSYVMANPVIRKAYHQNLCDGYSDTYTDLSPGTIGFGHEAYEHAMNGVIEMPTKDDGNVVYSNFARAWESETSEILNLAQKASIQNTWRLVERLYEEGDRDPVSPWNASL